MSAQVLILLYSWLFQKFLISQSIVIMDVSYYEIPNDLNGKFMFLLWYTLPSSGYIWSYRHNIQHIPANVYHCKDTPFLIHVGLIIQSTEICHEDVSMLPMYMAYIWFVFIAICATYNLSIEDRGCHKCCNHRYTNSHI